MTLTQIAQALGASKSTALATARTLTAHGMLRSIDPGPRYKLGTALIHYGDLASLQRPIGEASLPILREVSAATGMTARIALSEDDYPVCIERVDGPGANRVQTPLGRREPPHATATGKAILAMIEREHAVELCKDRGLEGHTARTITDVETLVLELDAVRRRGYAIDDEETIDGIFCVGAPFFDHAGACAGAISVTGLKHDLPGWRLAEMGRLVGRHADEVSKLLGGPILYDVTGVTTGASHAAGAALASYGSAVRPSSSR
jgi:IclR family acetate operon transcriptional repressor